MEAVVTSQKWIVFFTFLVLFACIEETKLAKASEFTICEHERRNITCPPEKIIQVLQASYSRHDRETCPDLNQYTNNTFCLARKSSEIVKATCEHKPWCELFANNSVFGDPCFGTFKYLTVSYQCVELPVYICERERRNISCSPGKIIHILHASYGRHDRETCPHQDRYMNDTNCHAGNSHAIVGATCGYKSSCEIFANNSVFGDPCPGTYNYLKVEYRCLNLFVLCQGTSGPLSCPEGKTIKVVQASYGRHDRANCPSSDMLMNNTSCHSEDSHLHVQAYCHNMPSCKLYALDGVFGDPCPGTYKYLRVMYECTSEFRFYIPTDFF